MDAVSAATILVALIAAAGAWASQRAAHKVSVANTITSGRVDMEKEAYNRARAYDTETIKRQDEEIAELRACHKLCLDDIKNLKLTYELEIKSLRRQIAGL